MGGERTTRQSDEQVAASRPSREVEQRSAQRQPRAAASPLHDVAGALSGASMPSGAAQTAASLLAGQPAGRARPSGIQTKLEVGGADAALEREAAALAAAVMAALAPGNDVQFAPGQFQPGTPGGQHLIAHEFAHVLQQRGGIHRLMWTQDRFDTETSQLFTTKSTAQKEIRTLLAEYHTKFPFGDLDVPTAKSAFDHVTRMKLIADAYIAKNVKTVDGEDIERSSRSDRIAGMRAFATTCEGELSWLNGRIDRGKSDEELFDTGAATQRVSDEAGVKKITDHYSGDAVSCFRKLGRLIEAAAPAPGDNASVVLEVSIPCAPGLAVKLGFEASASRGDRAAPDQAAPIEIGLNINGGVAGNVMV